MCANQNLLLTYLLTYLLILIEYVNINKSRLIDQSATSCFLDFFYAICCNTLQQHNNTCKKVLATLKSAKRVSCAISLRVLNHFSTVMYYDACVGEVLDTQ